MDQLDGISSIYDFGALASLTRKESVNTNDKIGGTTRAFGPMNAIYSTKVSDDNYYHLINKDLADNNQQLLKDEKSEVVVEEVPEESPNTLFGIAKKLLWYREDLLKEQVNLDGYIKILFLKYSLVMLIFATVIANGILLPFYIANGDPDLNDIHQHDKSVFDSLSIAYHLSDNLILTLVTVLQGVFTFASLIATYKISKKTLEIDFETQLLDQKFVQKRTVMIKGIKQDLTPDEAEEKITDLFNKYYGNEIQFIQVRVMRDCSQVEDMHLRMVAARTKANLYRMQNEY